MKEITSRDNQWIKLACAVKRKKERTAQRRVFLEGRRLVTDAVENEIRDGICFVSPKGREQADFDDLFARGVALGWDFFSVTESVYDKLKDTQSPQGIAAVVPFFTHTLQSLEKDNTVRSLVYLQAIQDPGNLGTIIRTAAATDCGAVILSPGSVDVYNDKTLRSAMGAIFKVPLIENIDEEEICAFVLRQGRVLFGTSPQGRVSYAAADYKRPAVLAFGNEGQGLTAAFAQCCDELLSIPMRSNTESLNLATAVGLVLYRAWEANGFAR